jgi:hypothetical protein
LKELRFSGGIPLEDPKFSFRSDAYSRGPASTHWQIHRVGVGETHRLLPFDALQVPACAAVWAIANGRVTARWHGRNGKRSKRCLALIGKLLSILREASSCRKTGSAVAVFRGVGCAGGEKPAPTASSRGISGYASTGINS